MFITFTKTGLIVCACIIAAAQLAKYLLKKFKVNDIWIKCLPIIIFALSYIGYAIMLKTFGTNTVVSSLSLTAISCSFYDIIKAIIQLAKSIFHKEK